MSTRVWVKTADGERGKPRPIHRPAPITDDPRKRWTCAECGEPWYWTHPAKGPEIRRHYPGTFWQDDSDRSRW